jgi:hypothetical protein
MPADTLYDYDTGTSQCAWCFGQAPCAYDHETEEEAARVAEAQLLNPSKPSPVLHELESAEGPMTAMELSAATHLLVETVEDELIRLEAKGLVHQTSIRRWTDRLRSVPSI